MLPTERGEAHLDDQAPPRGTAGRTATDGRDDLGRSQRALLIARLLAVPWGLVTLATHGLPPYPPRVLGAGYLLMALLGVGAVLVFVADTLDRQRRRARLIALVGLALDVAVVGAFVWLNAFDPGAALWAVLFILPLEGASLFGLPGALLTWLATAGIYTARDAFVIDQYGGSFSANSVAFRMGIGFLIALVAGLMARNLTRERQRLARALEDLQHVDDWRRRLLGALGHDVRNPLATVIGSLRTLSDHHGALDDDTALLLLGGAHRQAVRLERLASGLLDLAKLEEGRLVLDIEDVDVGAVVFAIVELQPATAERVTWAVERSVVARADRDRLEQVLYNLVDNAHRHGAPPISIAATVEDERVLIRVTDGGDGFDGAVGEDGLPDDGYGLTVVKGLVEAMDGTVTYERGAGTSRFTLDLPASSPAMRALAAKQQGHAERLHLA